MPLLQTRLQLREQQGGEDAVVAAQELGPHVRHGHRGQGPSSHPVAKLDEPIAAAQGPIVAQQRRRGAAQQQLSAARLHPAAGDVQGVVSGRDLALVAGFVLLVDDDEPQILHRGEHRAAGADDDGRLAQADAPPLVEPFPGGEAAVEHRDPVPEAGGESAHGLGRQGDLRHQHDGALPLLEAGFDAPEVHLRLAAARDPVEEGRLAGGEGLHLPQGGRLFLRELWHGLSPDAVLRATEHREAALRQHPLLEQGGDGRGGPGQKGLDVRDGHGLAGLLEQRHHVRLDVGFGDEVGGGISKIHDPFPLLVDAAAPELGGDHEPEGVHQETVIRLLHPFRQGDLTGEEHRVGLHAGQDVLDRHPVLQVAFLRYGQDEAFLHVIPLPEGQQHVLAGANVQPLGYAIGKGSVHRRMGDVHDHLGKHVRSPLSCPNRFV